MTEKGSGERRGFVFVTYTSFEAVDKVTDKPFHKIGEKEVGWFGGGREGGKLSCLYRQTDKGPSLSVGRSSMLELVLTSGKEVGWFGGGTRTERLTDPKVTFILSWQKIPVHV